MAAVESGEDPWLGGVEVDALDPLRPGKKFSLPGAKSAAGLEPRAHLSAPTLTSRRILSKE